MGTMPKTRAQLAFDIVGSSGHDDDLLPSIRTTSEQLLRQSFAEEQIDFDVRTTVSPSGDGDLMSFPEPFLPRIIDAAYRLESLLYDHNRRNKPEIPMRLSIHAGPLQATAKPSFQRGYIELTRMLESDALKAVVRRCQQTGSYTLAVILSEHAYRTAVRARHTVALVPHNFADVRIHGKNFDERCWIHVPGTDAARIAEYARSVTAQSSPGVTAADPEPDDAARNQATASSRAVRGNVVGNAVAGDSHGTTIANFGTWRAKR